VAKREGHRATDLPGTLADFAAAGTPEPVVLYRSLMTNPASTGSAYSAGICLDPPPGELAEPITLRDKLACVWKQLLAAPSQISVAVDLRSMPK